VARYDGRTGKRTARPYPYTPQPLTQAASDSIANHLLDSIPNPFGRGFLEGFESRSAARAAMLRPLDITEFHSPVTEVVAGADRTVWLREQASGRWVVLGRDGEVLGRVALPRGARLLHADAGSVWLMLPDRPGVPGSRTLIRCRVVKS